MRSKSSPTPQNSGGLSDAVADGPRAFPIREAFERIGVSPVTGYLLIKTGELESFLIGRRRFATAGAVASFLERCIAKSQETAANRAKKTAEATKASLAARGARLAA